MLLYPTEKAKNYISKQMSETNLNLTILHGWQLFFVMTCQGHIGFFFYYLYKRKVLTKMEEMKISLV